MLSIVTPIVLRFAGGIAAKFIVTFTFFYL